MRSVVEFLARHRTLEQRDRGDRQGIYIDPRADFTASAWHGARPRQRLIDRGLPAAARRGQAIAQLPAATSGLGQENVLGAHRAVAQAALFPVGQGFGDRADDLRKQHAGLDFYRPLVGIFDQLRALGRLIDHQHAHRIAAADRRASDRDQGKCISGVVAAKRLT